MKKPLNIAVMVRSYIPMPRPVDMIYAPIDLTIHVAKELGKRGHHVTIFAPIGTQVHGENVTVETMNLRALVNGQEDFANLMKNTEILMHDIPGLWDRYMSNEMFVRAERGEFDMLWFHHPETALTGAANHPSVPVAYTLHDPVYSYYREMFELYKTPNQHYISISNNQRRDAPDLPYAATVYNGTDVDMFTFSDEYEDYLLYAGRVAPQKGIKEAIQVARESNHRLLIIGPVAAADQGYFDQYIRPELDDKILYLGRVDQDRLPKYYQKAKALLTPVQWEEPFGLTTIEAMACGTPVISLHRGAAPEIIKDGKTGFIVGSVGEMAEKVGQIDMIKRADCRKHVEQRFGIKQMVDGYEAAFQEIIDGGRTKAPKAPKMPKGQVIKKLKRVRKLLSQ